MSATWILAVTIINAVQWDSTAEVHRAVFASCNRVFQHEGGDDVAQPAWEGIEAFSPEAFWWVGDAVYPKESKSEDSLTESYTAQNNIEGYKRVKSKLTMLDGTWDDHDYGVNDGGKDSYTPSEKTGIQNAFLNFLNVSMNTPRRERKGVYSVHKVSSHAHPDKSVALIFLDTRTHRDPHAIPSVGGYDIPGIALVSALTRFLSSVINVYSQGDVLGDEQWEWMEGIVKDLSEEVQGFIVVSSIQVNTSNPTVESWGHFPVARNRLYTLLNGSKSVLFVSGDVHFAEVSPNELTTSGLTHTCGTPFYGPLCHVALNTWTSHRATPTSFDISKNYLTVTFNWAADTLQFTVRDVSNRPLLYKDHILGVPTVLHDAPLFTLSTDQRVLIFCVTGTMLAVAGFLFITPHV